MNNRQKAQVVLCAIFIILLLVWLFMPGLEAGKILGIVSDLLMIASLVVSYIAEEKNKKSK